MRSPLVRMSTLVLAWAAATGLVACGRDDRRNGGGAAPPAIEPRVGAEAPPFGKARDKAITAAVKASLDQDNQLRGLTIRVDTHEGRVRLRGTAPDTDVRILATERARGVEGVLDVDNGLNVQVRGDGPLPPMPSARSGS